MRGRYLKYGEAEAKVGLDDELDPVFPKAEDPRTAGALHRSPLRFDLARHATPGAYPSMGLNL